MAAGFFANNRREIVKQAISFCASVLVFILTTLVSKFVKIGNDYELMLIGAVLSILVYVIIIKEIDRRGLIEIGTYPSEICPHKHIRHLPMQKRWKKNTIKNLQAHGLQPIFYQDVKYSVPAFEICNFSDQKLKVQLHEKPSNKESHFSDRVFTDNTSEEIKDQYTSREIREFGKHSGKKLDDGKAVWITGITKSDAGLSIFYEPINYFRAYAVSNSVGYMTIKFPREKDFPYNIIQENFVNFKNDDFDILTDIPSILGMEVIVVTSDNKFVFQRRSSKVAVFRNMITAGVSAGYEPDDFKENEPLDAFKQGAVREIGSELGLNPVDIMDIRLLGLVYLPASNEINFVFHVKISFSYDEFFKNLKERKPDEDWEHNNRLFPYDIKEIIDFSGKWKRRFKRDKRYMDRVIIPLYYLCREAQSNPIISG